MKKLILGIALLAVALVANAQRGGGFGAFGGGGANPMGSIARADVQAELKLTDDQKDKIAALTDRQSMFPKMQKFMQDNGVSMEDFRSDEGRKKMGPLMQKFQAQQKKEVEAVLTPEQAKRWNEITIQLAGNMAILNPDIAKALAVTDAQNDKIKDLQKKQQDAMQGLMQKMRDGELTQDDMREKMTKNAEILDAELGKILTDDQKAKLKAMGGAKFEKKDDN